jgi:hypothetical protein
MGSISQEQGRVMNIAQDVTAPPHSQEAEMGVLGSMLQGDDGSEAIAEAMAKIGEEYFYVPAHRTIFTAICDLYDARQAIDLITFTQSLRDKKLLDSVGGPAFVTELATFVPTAANVQFYIDIVSDKYILRETQQAAEIALRRTTEAQENESPHVILDELESRIASLRSLHGRNGDRPVSIISLAETPPEVFERDNLLGNRFLCVEGGMLFVGPSGIGKSSASIQQDILWALGRPAFGIKPSRPLRILTVQAENDDGDLSEMSRGVCVHLELNYEDRKLVEERVTYIKEKSLTGFGFLAKLRYLVRKHGPDIVRIDPMHAYAGGDVAKPEVTTPFLRNGLNPILQEFRCAAIINLHTPKTTYRNTSDWKSSDWMYAGSGNADITNWARAILVVDATRVPDAFVFRAAKRGSRIGWIDDEGSRIYERLFCHHRGGAIYWREAEDEDIDRVEASNPKDKRLSPKTAQDLKALVPLDGSIAKPVLIQLAKERGIGEKRARSFLAELLDPGELHKWLVPRSGTNPEVRISRHVQTLI